VGCGLSSQNVRSCRCVFHACSIQCACRPRAKQVILQLTLSTQQENSTFHRRRLTRPTTSSESRAAFWWEEMRGIYWRQEKAIFSSGSVNNTQHHPIIICQARSSSSQECFEPTTTQRPSPSSPCGLLQISPLLRYEIRLPRLKLAR
jgi:hypothetical protein